MARGTGRWIGGAVVVLLAFAGCQSTPSGGDGDKAAAPTAQAAPRRDPLVGGPSPALFLAVAQFTDVKQPDGKTLPVPGAAKLLIVRKTEGGWKVVTVED